MLEQSPDIDHLVREVVRRLQAMPTGENNGGTGDATSSELKIAKDVVSLEDLEGHTAVRRLLVRPTAVITPAVRDVVAQRGIILETSLHDEQGCAGTTGSTTLNVAVAGSNYDPGDLIRQLRGSGIQIQCMANSGLSSVIREMGVEAERAGTLGLLLTEETSLAACLANRCRRIRAALAADREGASEVVHGIGANLIIVNPVGKSAFELKRISVAFYGDGTRACPDNLREFLD